MKTVVFRGERMRIQQDTRIAGQPILAIRKLLKYAQRIPVATLTIIAEQLAVDLSTAEQIYRSLLEEGFIEPSDLPLREGEKSWYPTMKGGALANASTRKPITRKTAERLVEEFLARVRQLNACEDYVYRVSKVLVFGSFLSDNPTLGDVDLSIGLEDRCDPRQRQARHQARINAALEAGRTFHNFSEMLTWPQEEVYRFLKGRSPSISLHSEAREAISSQPIPSKLLFDASQAADVPYDRAQRGATTRPL
jgi:DNA-binding MarR family transcriptional regulator